MNRDNSDSLGEQASKQPAISPDDFIQSPLESVPADSPLPFPVYVKISDRLILFRAQGDKLTTRRVSSLRERVSVVYIPKESWVEYLDTLEKDNDTDTTPNESSVIRLRHLLLAYHQYLERKKSIQIEHVEKLRALGARLALSLKNNPSLGPRLLRRYDDPAFYFVNHNVNVAIYSAAVGHKLGLSLGQVKTLTFGALMHNLGNLFISPKILYKPGPLSDEEWQVVHRHPIKGAQLLEMFRLPREVILTALQHHERIDGEGYPTKAKGSDIHAFAKITTIADVYDALTNRAPYQSGLLPANAVEKMRHMLGKFEPQILSMLST
ncbi:MAG: HD domain-containing protein [Deltaproteobacteria bacterium]|nr:HD domain-containing protein [Deltaproteobacteria bacterium]